MDIEGLVTEQGALLVWLREQSGLTQEQLAAKSCTSCDLIRSIEQGDFAPGLRIISRLCAHGLGVSAGDLLEALLRCYLGYEPTAIDAYQAILKEKHAAPAG